jgi:hypothetical protein
VLVQALPHGQDIHKDLSGPARPTGGLDIFELIVKKQQLLALATQAGAHRFINLGLRFAQAQIMAKK